MNNSLYEEFWKRFKNEIDKHSPSPQGFEFDEDRLRELFHDELQTIVHAKVPTEPAVQQLLDVVKLDAELEYELQDQEFRHRFTYPLREAFRCAIEPFRRSKYAKEERLKAKEYREEWWRDKQQKQSEEEAAAEEQVQRERDRQHVLDTWEKRPYLHQYAVAWVLDVTDRTIRKYIKDGILKTNQLGQVTVESIKAVGKPSD